MKRLFLIVLLTMALVVTVSCGAKETAAESSTAKPDTTTVPVTSDTVANTTAVTTAAVTTKPLPALIEPERGSDTTEGLIYQLVWNDYYAVIGYDEHVMIEELVIPETYEGLPVLEISFNAFTSHPHITSVYIPDCVTAIQDGAFSGCEKLKSVRMPEKLAWIGDLAFCSCPLLETIYIPETVTWIGEMAFWESQALTLFCQGSAPQREWKSFWYDPASEVVWNYTRQKQDAAPESE